MKAGRSIGGGELNLEQAREQLGRLERALEDLPDPLPLARTAPAPFPSPDPPMSDPAHSSDLEAQLNRYLERSKAPKRTGFPPMDALAARLHELTAPQQGAEAPKETPTPREKARVRASSPAADPRPATDLAWFEEKFAELKTHFARKEADKSEIISINAKLAEIIGRVDRLAAALPGEKTMAAVETQLSQISRSLETTRGQSASDADRISRAAKEILAASERAELARTGFENAARHTIQQLGQTVAVTATRTAALTAEQIASVIRPAAQGDGLTRVEHELRELNALSRESGERTTAALERVHQTLKTFLEKGAVRAEAASPKKRAAMHEPISAGAPAYARRDSNFGIGNAPKPQLNSITQRTPQDFPKSFSVGGERYAPYQWRPEQREEAEAPYPYASPPPETYARSPREEEKALPLFGLVVVAVVLLFASAALFYLHAKPELPQLHLSVLPDVSVLPKPPSSGQQSAATAEAQPQSLLRVRQVQGPALLTAADQNHDAAKSLAEFGEELQMLTSAASKGDREAQFRIGARFLSDSGVQGAATTAARWLARAAEQGHRESQFVLASLYERGAGVPKDEALARDFYRRAASAGHIRAMHNLAVLLSAQDLPQAYQEAARWFMSAALAGLTDSQFNLALLYERGLGLQQNNRKAYFWYEVAALAGDKEAGRQAERVKLLIPDADGRAASQEAGVWAPQVEDMPRVAQESAVRG